MTTTTTNALIFAVISTATLGLGVTSGASEAIAPVEVVKLERVVIEGRRADAPVQIAKLPRVIVVGRRADAATLDGTQLAAVPARVL